MSIIPPHLAQKVPASELAEFVIECQKLRQEVIAEFADEVMGTRKHYSQRTYMDGCSGPLCLAAHRVSARKVRGSTPTEYWSRYEPILVWFQEQVESELHAARIDTFNSLFQQDDIEDHNEKGVRNAV